MHERTGTSDGGYLFIDRIGAGGFGSVYRAQRADEPVRAVKVLLADLVATPLAVQRFEREIEIIQSLEHPSCVEIFDSGRLSDGSPYFAMELLEGENLAARLRREGRMTPQQLLDVMRPVCSVLLQAHRRGVVHRDIKAENVFLCDDGRVLLLDFGIAKLVTAPGMSLTLSRQLVGTPCAMAPEQLTDGDIDARTDVYALGALAYYMLTGEMVFPSSSATVMQHLHQHAARPRPSSRAPLGSAIDRVVVTAMSIAAQRRPADAGAFLQQLEDAVHGTRHAQDRPAAAVAVFAHLGRCGDDALLVRRSCELMDTAIAALRDAGFEVISLQSRGFVCACITADGAQTAEPAVASVDSIRQAFLSHAPDGSEMYCKIGEARAAGTTLTSGPALIPTHAESIENGHS